MARECVDCGHRMGAHERRVDGSRGWCCERAGKEPTGADVCKCRGYAPRSRARKNK
jgi:hypothetical protein